MIVYNVAYGHSLCCLEIVTLTLKLWLCWISIFTTWIIILLRSYQHQFCNIFFKTEYLGMSTFILKSIKSAYQQVIPNL